MEPALLHHSGDRKGERPEPPMKAEICCSWATSPHAAGCLASGLAMTTTAPPRAQAPLRHRSGLTSSARRDEEGSTEDEGVNTLDSVWSRWFDRPHGDWPGAAGNPKPAVGSELLAASLAGRSRAADRNGSACGCRHSVRAAMAASLAHTGLASARV